MLARQRVALAAFFAAAAFLLLGTVASSAQAYPWMIRHKYSGCGACHYDPSGGGALTQYGRLVGTSVMQTAASDDAEKVGQFLFGAVPLPEWLELGGDVRVMALSTKSKRVPITNRLIWMQLDGEASVSFGRFLASGSLGYAPAGALGAALTRYTQGNLISRQHWLGYQLSDSLTLRAGRMNLPFGIRTIEHTLWARNLTRTSVDDDQQFGAAAYFEGGPVRGEIMGIAGSFQLRPDDYRERGYSAYVELEPLSGLAAGLSSLVTHRDLDTITLKETWRQAHGAFARWATPYQPLVLSAEGDYVFQSSLGEYHRKGPVGYLQADWEPFQGMHFIATGEANKIGVRKRAWSYAGWLSYAWFPLPHFDVRLDGIYQSLGSASDRTKNFILLLQGHVYL